MLQLRYQTYQLAFQYPFTTAHGTKDHQPTLVVALGLGNTWGFGEAPAISYYGVVVEEMVALLESKRKDIERYALTDPARFWHFLHHLIPGQHFLTAALDIAGWDLFSRLGRKPLHQALGIKWEHIPFTDYTIGIDQPEKMVQKLLSRPMPAYKIKVSRPDDIAILEELRKHTTAPFRIDANEGWTFDEAKSLLPELQKLDVILVEQPLERTQWDAMKELKAHSSIPLIADESCRTENEVKLCADAFHGINIKLTKCGGITPALRMIAEACQLGLSVMLGSMNESSVGTAAFAHLLPLADYADLDGPLLLCEDVATGLVYENGVLSVTGPNGSGITFKGAKFDTQSVSN